MTGLNDRYLDAVLFAAYTVGSVAGLILVKSNMATAKTLLMTREWLAAPVFLSHAGAASALHWQFRDLACHSRAKRTFGRLSDRHWTYTCI